MTSELQQLHRVWLDNRSSEHTSIPQTSFGELTNSIISTGPFCYFVIDFFNMGLSNVSPSLQELTGFDPGTVTFNDILSAIHPDDVDFVVKAEAFLTRFFFENIGREKLLNYKISYNFRGKLNTGDYVMFNHQAMMLTLDENGGYGKSLNINTRIDHLTNINNYKVSLIGLNGEPSFMGVDIDKSLQQAEPYSKRETDVIRLLAEGLSSKEIADRLFISELTVKTHRKNILEKADCKNTTQLISVCIRQGLI
jgi:DNA-binding CsgD family transcriptional regulator